MKSTFLMAFLFMNTIIFAQHHSDLKELGHKGKVKRLTIYTFDSAGVDQRTKKIIDPTNWSNKSVEVFDKNGNYDTIYLFIRLNRDRDEFYSSRTVYKYSGGKRYALRYYGQNADADTARYVWINDSTYKTVEHNSKGKSTVETICRLDHSYRDKAGMTKVYENDSLLFGWTYTNELGKDKLMMRNTMVSEKGGETTVIDFEYFDKDKHGNPTRVIRTYGVELKYCDVVTNEFEYW